MHKNIRRRLAILLIGLFFLIVSPRALAAPVRIVNSQIGKQLNLPVYVWVDRAKKTKGTIVAVHGLTLYADCWNDLAMRLAAKGYRVVALDMRGFGRWCTESSKFGGNNKVEIGQSQQDLLDLVTTVRQANPKDKLFGLGESLGTNMLLLLFSEHPELGNGAILASPCYKNRIHPKLRWAVDFGKELVKPDKPLNLTPYSAPYLTNDPALSKACNNDPLINRKLTPVELVKFDLLDDKAIAAASKLPANFPLLIMAGTEDAMFKSTELPRAIKKFGTQNISLNLLPGRGHLLLEHQRVNADIWLLIDKWLKQQSH